MQYPRQFQKNMFYYLSYSKGKAAWLAVSPRWLQGMQNSWACNCCLIQDPDNVIKRILLQSTITPIANCICLTQENATYVIITVAAAALLL